MGDTMSFAHGGAARLVAGVVALIVFSFSASAQSYNQFVGFGDSTVDSGWWKAALPGNATQNPNKDPLIANSIAQGGTGAPVGAGYLMNSQLLASYFGLSAVPANQPGGSNYAISGALDAAVAGNGNAGNANPNPSLPSTVQQIANYLVSVGGHANPNALYYVSSGGNDLKVAPIGQTLAEYLTGQATLLANAIASLQAAGAKYIVVADSHGQSGFSMSYTRQLWSDLAARGVNFVPADIQAMVRVVQANPFIFGFTPATVLTSGAACVNTTAVTSGWAQWCVNSTTITSSVAYLAAANSQFTSFYADDEHFSAAGQKIEADYIYNLLVAPSEISFFAEAPLKIRAALIETIFTQIRNSQQQVGSFSGWASGDVSWLKINNPAQGFPNDPGTPVAATAGFDYKLTRDWLVGLAFSLGTTKQTFSLGGDYKMDEVAVSAYAAFLHGPWWTNLVAGYGSLHFDDNRIAQIGIATVRNTGSTPGSNISFAAEGGYNFVSRISGNPAKSTMPLKADPDAITVKQGPVAGIILQQVHVSGFSETDSFFASGGLTALSFGSQTRNSAVSELGYQITWDIGRWHPFGKLAWNHELLSTDRLITASLTTVAAPSFSLPAVNLGRDWGSGIAGTRITIAPGVLGYVACTSQVGQHATIYGAQFGINLMLDPYLPHGS
jgi:outer membrane lipase/esterase